MKATVKKFEDRFTCIGLEPLEEANGETIYEICYLYTFSGKSYKTEKNAIRALEKNGFEYIKVNENQLVCAYN